MPPSYCFKVGDLIEMQLAFEENASGIVIEVDPGSPNSEFPPYKIHWFSVPHGQRVAGLHATWQNIDEIELVSRG
jgi:hypothetical protein